MHKPVAQCMHTVAVANVALVSVNGGYSKADLASSVKTNGMQNEASYIKNIWKISLQMRTKGAH